MVAWTNDMLGQVVRRSEKDNQSGGDPHEIWHRFSGRQMGYVGNNGNYDVTYYTSRALRQSPGGPSSFADFDLAHDHINSYEQGSHGGVYTVQSGDTLQGIAAALWGDASLWYKIAEVNGLTASSTLIEGQPLLIPVGVQRNENNAATYQPYDPLEVLGNTSPTSPKPKQNACGTGGQVLLVIIAVVVTVVMAAYLGVEGAITSGKIWAAVIGGATAGAAGSVASQGVGVATGIQEKFSWNAVALSAIGGGVGAGVGAAGAVFGGVLSNSFVQGALGSAITQGIGYATGLQDKFSWAGVAAAGVGATFAEMVVPSARLEALAAGGRVSGPYLSALTMRSGAAAIANAATRSLMNGGDFGDNLMAALPDVIGQTLGEAIAGGIAHRERIEVKPIKGEPLEMPEFEPLAEPVHLPAIRIDTPQSVTEVLDDSWAPFFNAIENPLPAQTLGEIFAEAAYYAEPFLPDGSERMTTQSRPTLGEHASVVGAAVRDHGGAWIADTLGALVDMGRVQADLTMGYSFDALRLAGVHLPEYAPSLIGHLSDNVQMGLALADFVQQPDVQREALVWSGLFNPYASRWSSSVLAGRAQTALHDVAADYQVDPLGTTYRVAGGVTYGGLTVLSLFAPAGAAKLPALMSRVPRLSFAAGQRSQFGMSILGPPRLPQVQVPPRPNPQTGQGYGVNDPPVRISGQWSTADYFNALNGRSPSGLGSPALHHADQMPGSGIHEVLPDEHVNAALHPNRDLSGRVVRPPVFWRDKDGVIHHGVTDAMRQQDRNLHWWYRAREEGADQLHPNWIYD